MNLKFNVPKHVLNYTQSLTHTHVTYSSNTYSALSESVEVLEELFDPDTVLENFSLESSFNIQFNVK